MKTEIHLPSGYRKPIGYELLKLPPGSLVYSRTEENWIESQQIGLSGCCDDTYCVPIAVSSESLDPKQQHGENKPQLHLIPLAAQEEMAKALALGKTKYGERNWLLGNGVNLTVYLSALERHIGKIKDGLEDIDPESGAHHLGHVMANCGIVLDALRHGKLVDDRVLPPKKP